MSKGEDSSKTLAPGSSFKTNNMLMYRNNSLAEGEENNTNDNLGELEQDDENLAYDDESLDNDNSIDSPDNSLKDEAKSEAKKAINKGIWELIKKNPHVLLIVGGVILGIFLILIIIMAVAGVEDEEGTEDSAKTNQGITYYYDPTYDFTRTVVNIINPLTGEEVDSPLIFEDLVKGMVYADTYDKIENLSDDEKLILFEASLVVLRSVALSNGMYNNETKEITLNSGTDGVAYCDVYYGCKIINENSMIAYIPVNYNTRDITENIVGTIEPMDKKNLELLDLAYEETEYLLLVPMEVEEAITTFDHKIIYTADVLGQWADAIENYSSYKEIIYNTTIYDKYKIYDLADYVETYTLSGDSAWWWPIGSTSADEDGLYSGDPVESTIIKDYEKTYTESGSLKFHDGIDIQAECGSNVIASKAGVVEKVGYEQTRGHYVIISHKDGDKSESRYYHLKENSIVVKEDDIVNRGQLIGIVGPDETTGTCYFHFTIYANNSAIDPNQHVSLERARATSVEVYISYVEGKDNKQSICLTLKASGFSNEATAALLSNIQSESSFNPTVPGDFENNIATSYGLCQWHNSRWTRLQNYCGTNIDTISCQLDYLIHELKESYTTTYNELISNTSAYSKGHYFCYNFEIPASRETGCIVRGNNATAMLSTYVKPQTAGGTKGCGVD